MSEEKANKLNVSINVNTILTLAGTAIISLLLWANKSQLQANHQDTLIQVQSLQHYCDQTFETAAGHQKDLAEVKAWLENISQRNSNPKNMDKNN